MILGSIGKDVLNEISEQIQREKQEEDHSKSLSSKDLSEVSDDDAALIKSYGESFPDAQMCLAFMCLQGKGADAGKDKAEYWFKKAAEKGITLAKANLGYLYLNCDDASAYQPSVAQSYLSEAAEEGDKVSAYNLAVLYTYDQSLNKSSISELTEAFSRAKEMGSSEANEFLGYVYQHGFSTEPSESKAIEFYENALKANPSDRVLTSLGTIYCLKGAESPDFPRGLELLKKAAQHSFPPALNKLGIIYCLGLGGTISYEDGAKYFKAAGEKGYADSYNKLGLMHYFGIGFGKSVDNAEEYFLKAAEGGCAEAQYNLAVLYFENKDLKNSCNALTWLERAVHNANNSALNKLGECYVKGSGYIVDLEEGASLFKRSAFCGDSEGQYCYGLCCYFGIGREKSIKDALHWFYLAGENGLADGYYAAGVCLTEFTDIKCSDRFKAMFFEKAASMGICNAQFNTALCYINGDGVDKSTEKAKEWFSKAAEQGDSKADILLQKINSGADVDFHIYSYRMVIADDRGLSPEKSDKRYSMTIHKGAEKGNPEYMYLLGKMLLKGKIFPEDKEKGLEYLKKSAELGCTKAMIELGYGLNSDQDRGTEEYWNRKAADLGDPEGIANLISYYQRNSNGDKEAARKIDLLIYQLFNISYEKFYPFMSVIESEDLIALIKNQLPEYNSEDHAVKLGVPSAQIDNVENLTYLSSFSTNLKHCQLQLCKLYELTAKQWFGPSLYKLANLYYNGIFPKEKSLEKAVALLQLAVEYEDVDAMYLLANIYLKGEYPGASFSDGAELMKRASDRGDERAEKICEFL